MRSYKFEMKVDLYLHLQITDDTNIGDAFAWMPMTWGFGTTIGHVDSILDSFGF